MKNANVLKNRKSYRRILLCSGPARCPRTPQSFWLLSHGRSQTWLSRAVPNAVDSSPLQAWKWGNQCFYVNKMG